MKRYFSLLLALSLTFVSAFSQVKISGSVIDSKSKQAVGFASLSLLKQDSTFVAAAAADDKGLFAFKNIAAGNYILSAYSIGYEKSFKNIVVSGNETNVVQISIGASSVVLKNVSVTGHTTIQKADRKLLIPSSDEIKVSNDGISLLQNMHLPRVTVDQINSTVTVPGGGDVQFRINGVQVTNTEIKALAPADIIRIEYHENPGMRYGDAAAVLDYITHHRNSGGSIALSTGNAPFQDLGWGENNVSAKVNNKNSEFSVNGYWGHRSINWYRENTETFNFPNKVLTREESGEPTRFKFDNGNYSANYNLNIPQRYMLNVNLRNSFEYTPNSFTDRNSLLYSSDNPTPLSITDHSSERSNAPALDVYFQKNLNRDQLLIFDVVGTYIDSHTSRLYQEIRNNEASTDIHSDVSGDKYSLIAEGIYEKTLKNGKLTAGLKHNQSFTSNEYTGNVTSNVDLKVAETYLYAEYLMQKGKFSYTYGLGLTRTYNSQGDLNNESYILRPKLHFNYNINKDMNFYYDGSVRSTSPSLSDLNNVVQDIDSLQIRKGNPDLKTVWFLSNKMDFNYNKGIFGFELFAHYLYYNKPMMEQITFNGDKFVQQNINQKAMHQIYTQATFNLKPWKDYIVLNFSPEFNRFISKGTDYTHTFSYWRTNTSVTMNYKGFFAGAEVYSRWENLWGEDIQYGEKMHIINFGYNKPHWNLAVMLFNPFSKRYDQSSENLSTLAPNTSYVYTDNLSGTFAIKFSMNLDFGRKFTAGNKRVNNQDTDSGIMSGTKN